MKATAHRQPRRATTAPARRAAPVRRSQPTAEEFMGLLRDDHAGLSRVLREVDAQQSMLTTAPESARPVLVEAMRYLLVYQHSVHHPREDQLFARIRARQPHLYRNMQRLVRQHRIGQERAEALARDLARTTIAQLRGKAGLRLSRQLEHYVQATREHMRREEAVFYTGSERVLRANDWAALLSGPTPRDPAGSLERLAVRYPRLAARLAQPERLVKGTDETVPDPHGRPGFRQGAERFVERVAELLHESADVARGGVEGLRKVRSPLGLARVTVDFGARSCVLAAKAATLPFRP